MQRSVSPCPPVMYGGDLWAGGNRKQREALRGLGSSVGINRGLLGGGSCSTSTSGADTAHCCGNVFLVKTTGKPLKGTDIIVFTFN